MSEPYAARLDSARSAMIAAGVAAMCVGPGADLRYLCGYDALALERLTLLVVRATGDPLLVVPTLERPRAESQGVPVPIRDAGETEDPFAIVVDAIGGEPGDVLVSDRLWAAFVLRLQAALPGRTFDLASRITSALRVTKDAHEIAALREAARIADEVARALASEKVAGRPEREVSRWITESLLGGGTEHVNFAIVAAAENAASPHHEPGERIVEPGDALVCDFGGTLRGYCSDITRTFVVGEPSDELARVHDVVRRANDAAFDAARPGAPAASVDAAARAVIAAAGYGEHFIHRTGHGIGLDEHEDPYIVDGNETRLRAGMTFSIEPGIYLPGRFGVRIEDIVAITERGAERLNEAPRELISLPA